jgi:hypothetical protein
MRSTSVRSALRFPLSGEKETITTKDKSHEENPPYELVRDPELALSDVEECLSRLRIFELLSILGKIADPANLFLFLFVFLSAYTRGPVDAFGQLGTL